MDESTEKRRSYQLILPFPPSVNHYWRHYEGRTLLSAQGRKYRYEVRGAVYKTLQRAPEPLRGPLSIDIEVAMPDRRKRDLDNLLKGLLDALAYAKIYEDDSQLHMIVISRYPYPVAKGRVSVNVFEQT